MRSTSTKQQRANGNSPDRERHSRTDDYPVFRDVSGNRESASAAAEFLAVFNALASVNQVLLSSIQEVVASIRVPGAELLIEQIANQAESIWSRMSLMERLAAELRDPSD